MYWIPLLQDNSFQKTWKFLSLNVNLNFSCNYYALILSKIQTETNKKKSVIMVIRLLWSAIIFFLHTCQWFSMYVRICAFEDTQRSTHMHTHVEARGQPHMWLLWCHSFSTGLELVTWSLGICLFPAPQVWEHRCTPPHLVFLCWFWEWSSALSCEEHHTAWATSTGLAMFIFWERKKST